MEYLNTFALDALATPAFLLEPDKIVDQMSSSGNPSTRKVKRGSNDGVKLMTLPQ